VDIGTTSVKAVAVDPAGTVVARARVAHRVGTPSAGFLEHDPRRAWRQGPRKALAEVSAFLEGPAAGVVVSAMVPSITAVDRRGVPRLPGLLYGDARARDASWDHDPLARRDRFNGEREEGARMLAWAARELPGAAGYWPAQGVATNTLCGVPAVDFATGTSFGPLLDRGRWDRGALAALGVDERQVSVLTGFGEAAGTVAGTPTVVGGGSVDAFCEQMVAGADAPGDVLVIFGATLVVWAVTDEWREAPGLTSFPSMSPGLSLIGGPSNAGGLFADWVGRMVGERRPPAADPEEGRPGDPGAVPVWLPYPRGERTPFHDPGLTASLHGLDITQGPGAVRRAAHEASGFVIRRIVELAGADARRIVATGGGSRSVPWMQAVADATGLPVDTVGVPEGAALGAAYLARMAAGLTSDFGASTRWASHGRRIEPDPAWAAAADARYGRFAALGPAY
jgi:xylulokinase